MAPIDPNRPPRVLGGSSPAESGGSMADRIRAHTTSRVPPPPGRRYVLYLIGLAMVVALWITFTQGGGAGDRIRKGVEERDRKPRLPAERPTAPPESGRGEAQVVLEPIESPLRPTPAPAPASEAPPSSPTADIPLPAGLSVGLARQLRLNLGALGAGRLAAEAAFRELPLLVAATPEDRRSEVLGLVLSQVTEAALRGPYRREAFDAALALGATGEPAARLVEVAAAQGLDDDGAAAAAILFLGTQPEPGAGTAARLDALLLDPFRPLHLRVLAAQVRPQAGRPEAIERLAASPETPPALRAALQGR